MLIVPPNISSTESNVNVNILRLYKKLNIQNDYNIIPKTMFNIINLSTSDELLKQLNWYCIKHIDVIAGCSVVSWNNVDCDFQSWSGWCVTIVTS